MGTTGSTPELSTGTNSAITSNGGILVQGVAKSFGKVVALDHIDLTVHPREIVALLGPNGAGKSTLLRILATITLPDQGRAFIGDVDVAKDPRSAQRLLGASFGEERAWYWRLTGRQNLEFFAAMYGLRRGQAASRINVLLDDFALTHVADRRFDGYSAGMKVRFSLMRALLASPRVLLLDEPTRSLDPIAANEFRIHIRRLRETDGIAVLLATHDLHEAAELGHRIGVLVKGRIEAWSEAETTAESLQRLLIETVSTWT